MGSLDSRSISELKELLIAKRHQGDLLQESRLCNAIGSKYQEFGKYRPALQFHKSDLDISKGIRDHEGCCVALGNIADCCVQLSMYSAAMEYHQQRIKIARRYRIQREQFFALGGLGSVYFSWALYSDTFTDMEHLATAQRYFQESLAFASDATGSTIEVDAVVRVRVQLADSLCELGKSKEAAELYQNAIAISHGKLEAAVFCYLHYCEFLLSEQRHSEFLTFYNRLVLECQRLKCDELDAHCLYGRFLLAEGKFEEAMNCYMQVKEDTKSTPKKDFYAAAVEQYLGAAINRRERLCLMKHKKQRLSRASGNTRFQLLEEFATEYLEMSLESKCIEMRSMQKEMLVDGLSVQWKTEQEFWLNFGIAVEAKKDFSQALHLYKVSLRMLEEHQAELDAKSFNSEVAAIFCNIGNTLDGMDQPISSIEEAYKEAIKFSAAASDDELSQKIECNLYESYWAHNCTAKARDLQKVLRERYPVAVVAASAAELEELKGNFSYFANRKASKKLMSLIGNFPMRPKCESSLGLNLKKKRKSRDSDRKVVRIRAKRSAADRALQAKEENFFAHDEPIVKKLSRVISSDSEGVTDVGKNDNPAVTFDEEFLVDEEPKIHSSQPSLALAQLPFSQEILQIEKPAAVAAAVPIGRERSLEEIYKSSIKFYDHSVNTKILSQLKDNCVNLSKVISLTTCELQIFFKFLEREFQQVARIFLCGLALDDDDLRSIFTNRKFPNVTHLSLGDNFLSDRSLETLAATFNISNLQGLQLHGVKFSHLSNLNSFLSATELLREISLSNCELAFTGDPAFSDFLLLLTKCKSLSLDVSYNNFTLPSLRSLIRTLTLRYENLTSLSLSGIRCSKDSEEFLSDLYLCSKLGSLSLSNCDLGSLQWISSVLSKNLALDHLDISFNSQIQPREFLDFLFFLSATSRRLSKLSLAGNRQLYRCMQQLATPQNSSLVSKFQLQEIFQTEESALEFLCSFPAQSPSTAAIELDEKFESVCMGKVPPGLKVAFIDWGRLG